MSNEILDKGRRKFIGASLVAVPGTAVVSSGLLASGEASAQTKGAGSAKEPMVIGYPNKKGIQIERGAYPARNMGTEIAAYIFKPAGFDNSKKYPSIVVTHPFGGVKEQTSGLYSAFLAEQGFVTLAFSTSPGRAIRTDRDCQPGRVTSLAEIKSSLSGPMVPRGQVRTSAKHGST
jgi:uncharacterized protein